MADRGANEAAAETHSSQPYPFITSCDDTVWADVSPLLDAACSELRDGELIHGANFNLFAAMSALEIMDPKMDSGIVCKYYSVDEAIEDGAAPVPLSVDKTTDLKFVVDVMDHLLSCEATWHKGHSLAQTVYSCIYLLRLDRTSSHALLHSYCRIIAATCNAVISVVSDARTHEEDDLFTMAYGLPLNGNGNEKCLSMLNAVEEALSRQLRVFKAPLLKKGGVEEGEPMRRIFSFEEGLCRALLARLRFRKQFYHVLMSMRRPQGRGLEMARKHIALCLAELETVRKSSECLRYESFRSGACGTREEDIEDRTTASGRDPIGFDASLNSRFSAPTPPRAIKILSWKKAVDYFAKLLLDLDNICSYSLDSSLERILRYVVEFQKSQPDLVARAHLQHLLVQEGKLYGRDPTFSLIMGAAALSGVTKNHDIQKNELVVHLGQLIINLLKILCTNTAWQRRKLGKILQDWRAVYIQLELAFRKQFGDASSISKDVNASSNIYKHILIWVEEQTYWIAFRFLILGFEVDLYSTSEYCMVYWYIYVVSIKLAEKTHIKMDMSNDIAKPKGKKKRGTRDIPMNNQVHPAVLFLQCYICLAEGLTMMLAALRNEHRVLKSPTPFNSEQEQFIQHFELLEKACIPDQFSYPSFKESTNYVSFSTLVMYNYFKDAQRIAKELRSSFSDDLVMLAELRRIEQVAEHNSVALNVICRVGSIDPSLKVSFELNHHPFFATAIVKRF